MYLNSGIKSECFGCEACAQICSVSAITMLEDDEGFNYPVIDNDKCIGCGQCRKVCPYTYTPEYQKEETDCKQEDGQWHLRHVRTSEIFFCTNARLIGNITKTKAGVNMAGAQNG